MLAIRQDSALIWHRLVTYVGTECFKERKGLIDRAAVCTQCGAKVSPDGQEGVFRSRDWRFCAAPQSLFKGIEGGESKGWREIPFVG
jgi:hypothetical protein